MSTPRRLTRAEIQTWTRELSQCRTPEEMIRLCDQVREIAGNYLLTQPGTQFWREAFNGGTFARARGYDGVRLSLNERPDIELLKADVWSPFEVTEADDPARQRNKEYAVERGSADRISQDPESQWIARRHAIPEALRLCVQKKIALPYSPDCSLLIYLNLGTYGNWEEEIRRDIQLQCQPALQRFKEVWVLWSGTEIQVT